MATRYKRLRVVGKGSFGCCWLVEGEHQQHYILKEIDVSRMPKKEKDDAANELKVVAKLRHPFIINCHEFFVENGQLCTITDYAERGDLYRVIGQQRQAGRLLPEQVVLQWFTQIALALKHMHDRRILHRDLKTQNIFLTGEGDGTVKVGDFGIARVLQHTQDCARTAIGTPFYLSPEICMEKPYSFKSDVWSAGCVLYELATLHHAFDADSMRGLALKILRGVPPKVPSMFSPEFRALIPEMLTKDPERRPAVNEILQRACIRVVIRQLLSSVQQWDETQNHSRKPAAIREPVSQDRGRANKVSPRNEYTQPQLKQPDASNQQIEESVRNAGNETRRSLRDDTRKCEQQQLSQRQSHPDPQQKLQQEGNGLSEPPGPGQVPDSSSPSKSPRTSALGAKPRASPNKSKDSCQPDLQQPGQASCGYAQDRLPRLLPQDEHGSLQVADENEHDGALNRHRQDELETQSNRQKENGHDGALNQRRQDELTTEDSPHTFGQNLAEHEVLLSTLEQGLQLNGVTESTGHQASEPAPEDFSADSCVRPRFLRPDGDELHLPVSATDTLSYRIEALRVYIEAELGLANFVQVYRYLLNNAEAKEAPEDNSQSETRPKLESLVSAKAISFLPLVTQLIVCEDACSAVNASESSGFMSCISSSATNGRL